MSSIPKSIVAGAAKPSTKLARPRDHGFLFGSCAADAYRVADRFACAHSPILVVWFSMLSSAINNFNLVAVLLNISDGNARD